MNRKFGQRYPALALNSAAHQNQRLLLVAAAGFLSMLLLLLFTIFHAPREVASNGASETLAMNSPGSILVWTLENPAPASTKLSTVKLRQTLWPRNNVPETAVLDASEIRNMYALHDLPPNTPIQRNQLTTDPAIIRIPVHDGMRALPMESTPTEDSEGIFLPGARVDVAYSRVFNKELSTRLIVQNALVIACGGESRASLERTPLAQGQRLRCRTLTLEVTPNDALAVITAKKLGSLSLVARSLNDPKAPSIIDFPASKLDGVDPPKPQATNECFAGFARSDGHNWQVGCDGTLNTVVSKEPS